ncbi:replication associated protein [Antarctic virus COCH21_74]|nr:replication associated protein [Antarctic virus COCH21_74]
MPARFQGKTFLLTFAQADRIASKELLHEHLLTFLPVKLITCREFHNDGNAHFHAVMGFDRRQDFRNHDRFDYMGHHPNIVVAAAPRRAVEYVAKDGDYINMGWPMGGIQIDIYTALAEEIEAGTNPTEVIRSTIARTGTRGLRMYTQISGFVDRMMKPSAVHLPIKTYPGDFRIRCPYITGVVTKFLEDVAMGRGERGVRRSIWLWGPSRYGKTVLARSLGVHWYMGGGWCVDNFDDDADYGVLDDLTWDQLKYNYRGMLGLQRDIVVTDKYKKKTTVRGGRPVIVLTNELPEFQAYEMAWLAANVTFVEIDDKLFA